MPGQYGQPDDRNPGVGNTPPGANTGSGGGGGSSGGSKPIGVPEDYSITKPRYEDERFIPTHLLNQRGGLRQIGSQQVKPIYKDGDELVPARFSPDRIVQLQFLMHGVGLLGSFRRGVWDAESQAAYKDLLAYANVRGTTSQQALNELTEQAQSAGTFGIGGKGYFDPVTGEWVADPSGSGVSQRQPLVIRQSDPLELEKVFDDAVIKTLGQGWSRNQIQGMVRAYQQMEAERQRQAYNTDLTGGTVTDVPSPEAFAQNYAQQQDPQGAETSRFLDVASNIIPLFAKGSWGM